MLNEELWQTALSEIELFISKANFITWFKNTEIVSNENGVVIISVPNGFAKEWLENKYNAYISRALRNVQPDIKKVSCIIATPKENKPIPRRGQWLMQSLPLEAMIKKIKRRSPSP